MDPPGAGRDNRERMSVSLAVIPAAGAGSRLDRLCTPKPLVEVGGVPLVVRVLQQLHDAGIERAVVVTGADAELVERTLAADVRVPLPVTFVRATRWREGLGASLLAALPELDAPFVLAMADHVFDPRLVRRMVGHPLVDGEVAALVDLDVDRVFDRAGAIKVVLDRERVLAIGSLSTYDAIDAGLFAATPALARDLADAVADGGCSLSDAMSRVAARGQLRAVTVDGLRWDDVDTPAALVHTELRLRREHRRSARTSRPADVRREADYRFVTSAPATTELVVQRGCASGDEVDLGLPAQSSTSPIFVVTDETVDGLYGARFVAALAARGHHVHKLVMPDGERAKTLPAFTGLVEDVLARGIDEHSVIVSLGGGVVCNVAGFAAATLYRGVGLVHVPTTLMAQCDAAISHKQALNGARGKNLVGAYYAPQRIVVDIDFLATLDDRRLRDGLAEALKHALAQDPEYLRWFLAESGEDVRDPVFLEYVVRHNIELKCALMADDPKEHGRALVLQYAHNVAHAIEYLSGYGLTHGESVAIGMVVAANVSRMLGGCDDALVATHRELITRWGLPAVVPDGIATSDILAAMRYDKKTHTEGVRMPLLRDVGALWRVDGEYAIPVGNPVLARALDASRAP